MSTAAQSSADASAGSSSHDDSSPMEELRNADAHATAGGSAAANSTNADNEKAEGHAKGPSQLSEKRVVPGMPALTKTLSGRSVPISSRDHAGMTEVVRTLTQQSRAEQAKKGDAEAQDGLPLDANGNFDLEQFLKDAMGTDDKGRAMVPREMSVAWKHLTVTGLGAGAEFGSTVGSVLMAPFNIKGALRALRPPEKGILSDFSGAVKSGEMLLVLGRPGSGCTTLLKTLASYRDGFKNVTGEVLYEGLSHKVMEGPLRGELVYAPEDDVHFPTLNVGRTLGFAIAARAPQGGARPVLGAGKNTRQKYVDVMRNVLATTLGLRHTFKTPVGNELIRGISGGEKKRTSIAEILATRARIMIFDNSSRGLDSSTAVEFIQSLRILTNTTRNTTIASIYQAGEPIYRLFDKVVVLYSGKTIYFGPIGEAVDYFVDMGYTPHEHQTSADFLVSVTDPYARIIREGYEDRVPRTADEMEAHWKASQGGAQSMTEVDEELTRMKNLSKEDTANYLAEARREKAKRTRKSSPYLLSWPQQVKLCIQRRAQIIQGDMATQIVMIAATIIQGLVNGSVFYQMPKDSSGFFSRGGVLFFVLLYGSFLAQTEIAASYTQRPIIIRHQRFAMVRSSADAVANSIIDIPTRFPQTLIFDILIYWLTGLAPSADQFFILLGTTALLTYSMVNIFRFLAASFRSEANATMVGGLVIIWFALYAGYVVPRPSMVIWWKWQSYSNPIAFGFEILASNEFRRLVVPCASFVPAGPTYAAYSNANKACTVPGLIPGTDLVDGSEYLRLSYGYEFSNSPRNAGIIIGFWIFFAIAYAVASEFQNDPTARGGVMIFKRGAKQLKAQSEIEQAAAQADEEAEKPAAELENPDKLPTSSEIFAWSHINYDVPIKGAEKSRRLLNDVSGFVQPGKMTALMGESGAGKTTLLNVLAQRVNVGVVRGDFVVNGSPLNKSFQQQTGYCQQQDTHLATSTVREALEFSALLRQPTGTREEKLAYVEEVIDMLEMRDWTDALVGEVGQGLSVEQRKRLTIAVELCAKPKLLLFLDEPTSGLDSLAAWSIVRFLKKLANAGQSILCTIHQPSGELFSQFDRLILLKKGGEVVYAGNIHNSEQQCGKLLNYFETRSERECGDDNPAEFILECIGAGAASTTNKDWAKLYKDSELYTEIQDDLRQILARKDDSQYDNKTLDQENKEYATGFAQQYWEVQKRAFVFYWRSPVYLGAKIGLNIIGGLYIGSSFYGQGTKTTSASLQNKIFAIFIGLVVSTSLSQQLQPVFLQLRNVYEARERPSKIYTWPVLITTAIIAEVPWNFLGGTLFWIPWQFFVNFQGSKAYMWFMYSIVHQFYFVTFALAMAALAPNAMIASVLFSLFFSFVIVFCGVVQPPPILPYFWRAWMFPLSPFTYLVEGLMGNVLADQPIRCAPVELSQITPPAGQTCDQYLSNFSVNLSSLPAYGANPSTPGQGYYFQNADGTCSFCQYRQGYDFLTSLQLNGAYRFRDIGILFAYIAFNILLIYAVFWLFRIAKFSRGGGGGGGKKNKKSKARAKVEQVEQEVEEKNPVSDVELGGAVPLPKATTAEPGV